VKRQPNDSEFQTEGVYTVTLKASADSSSLWDDITVGLCTYVVIEKALKVTYLS